MLAPLLILTATLPSATAAATPVPPNAAQCSITAAPSVRSVVFTAAPSFTHRNWLIRLSQQHDATARLEILKLTKATDGDAMTIENCWIQSMTAADYQTKVTQISTYAIPQSGSFSGATPLQQAIVMDGTGITLHMNAPGWDLTRSYNYYDRGNGQALSDIFYQLMAQHVPQQDRPTPAWGTRR